MDDKIRVGNGGNGGDNHGSKNQVDGAFRFSGQSHWAFPYPGNRFELELDKVQASGVTHYLCAGSTTIWNTEKKEKLLQAVSYKLRNREELYSRYGIVHKAIGRPRIVAQRLDFSYAEFTKDKKGVAVPSCILQDRSTQLFVKRTDRLKDIHKLEVSSWTPNPQEAQRYTIEPLGEPPGSHASEEEQEAYEEKKRKAEQRFDELRSLGSNIVLLWL